MSSWSLGRASCGSFTQWTIIQQWKWKWSRSVVSDSLRPHGLEPTTLLHPWDFPGKSTGVGCHFLLQGIFLTQGLNPGLLHCRQMLYCLSHQALEFTVIHIPCHTRNFNHMASIMFKRVHSNTRYRAMLEDWYIAKGASFEILIWMKKKRKTPQNIFRPKDFM